MMVAAQRATNGARNTTAILYVRLPAALFTRTAQLRSTLLTLGTLLVSTQSLTANKQCLLTFKMRIIQEPNKVAL